MTLYRFVGKELEFRPKALHKRISISSVVSFFLM